MLWISELSVDTHKNCGGSFYGYPHLMQKWEKKKIYKDTCLILSTDVRYLET